MSDGKQEMPVKPSNVELTFREQDVIRASRRQKGVDGKRLLGFRWQGGKEGLDESRTRRRALEEAVSCGAGLEVGAVAAHAC